MATLTVGYLADGSAAASPNYATIALALAAASANDVIEVYYASVYKQFHHYISAISFNLNVTLRGMIGHQKLILGGGSAAAVFLVSASGTIENFTLQSGYGASYCIMNVNTAEITLIVNNCILKSEYNAIQWANGTLVCNNCIMDSPTYATYIYGTSNVTFNFCTVLNSISAYGFVQTQSSTVTCNNCIAVNCQVNYGFSGTIGGSHNAASDNTQPGTNGVNLRTGDAHFWMDEFPNCSGTDYRITEDSVLAGAGVAISGITTDMLGRTRADPPSIGPFEVWPLPTTLDADQVEADLEAVLPDGTSITGELVPVVETVSGASPTAEAAAITPNSADPAVVLDGESVVVDGETINGTATGGTPTDPDYVISSQGGNWNDTDVVAANLVVGAAAGVSDAIVGTAVVETHTQAEAPTAFTIASSDDGLTHTINVTGPTGAVYVIHDASHNIVASGIDGEKVRGLTAGTNYHCHARK